MSTIRFLRVILPVILIFGRAAFPAAGDAPVSPPQQAAEAAAQRAADEPIADAELLARAVAEGDRLIAAGQTTPTATLAEQLSRKQAAVRLPAADAGAAPAGAEDVYERAKRATLVIGGLYKCPRCAHTHCNPASGFVITADGVAVTNYHVVAAKQDAQKGGGQDLTLVAMTADGRMYVVKEVLAADQKQDVALVQLAAPGGAGEVKFEPLPVAPDAAAARPGADVYVLSHPNNRLFSFTRGTVSRYFRGGGPAPARDGPVLMQITADYAKGSSGGPVLNVRGEVVGMVAATTSVYYNEENGNQKNLQMVFKDCVPAAAIRALVREPGDDKVAR
jgi:hypothetical protein